MSPARERAIDHLMSMEPQLLALGGLTAIVRLLGQMPAEIAVPSLSIEQIGIALEELVEVLRENWRNAIEVSRGSAA